MSNVRYKRSISGTRNIANARDASATRGNVTAAQNSSAARGAAPGARNASATCGNTAMRAAPVRGDAPGTQNSAVARGKAAMRTASEARKPQKKPGAPAEQDSLALPALIQENGAERPKSENPFDAAEIERRGLLLREVGMRKERNKIRRKYILMILVSFLLSIALIYRYSFVIEINELIIREKGTLEGLQNENSLLQKQIGQETDLEKVRLLAESKLDMQKPDKDQIIYIKVPRKDHALVAAPEKSRETDEINPFEYLLEQARLIQKRLLD